MIHCAACANCAIIPVQSVQSMQFLKGGLYMSDSFKPMLCFGTFFVLLSEARRKAARKREKAATDKQLFEALQRVVLGSSYQLFSTLDPYKKCYRYIKIPCQSEEDKVIAFCSSVKKGGLGLYRGEVVKLIALLDDSKKESLVKAIIELICNSVDQTTNKSQIPSEEQFLIDTNIYITKSDLFNVEHINLPLFLMSVYAYILDKCKDNLIGKKTIKQWFHDNGKYQKKQFCGYSGTSLTKTITVTSEISDSNNDVDITAIIDSNAKSDDIALKSFLKQYFTSLSKNISDAKLYFSDSSYPSKLKDVYVSLPVNLRVDIEVKNSLISGIRIVESSESGEGKNYDDIGTTPLQSFLSCLSSKVHDNIEYKYQDPSKRPKILAPTFADGEKPDFWKLNGIDAVAIFQQLVILGEPGRGKSTLFKFFALKLIEQYNTNTNVFENYSISDMYFKNRYVPVFIELKEFITWYKKNDESCVDDRVIGKYIRSTYMANWKSPIPARVFSNKCIYLLDGLDEVTCNAENKQIIVALFSHIRVLSSENCRMILSCRERDFSEWKFDSFAVYSLQAMSPYAVSQLIKQVFDVRFQRIQPLVLLDELKKIRIDVSIVGNPLFLSLIAQLYLEKPEAFPRTKSKILEESILLLLKRKPAKILDEFRGVVDDLLPALERIAYEIQMSISSQAYKIEKMKLAGIICVAIEYCTLGDLEKFLKSTTGLLSESGEGLYEFTHRRFQEFLCASYLYKQPQLDAISIISDGMKRDKSVWAEVSILYLEMMCDRSDYDRIIATAQKLILDEAKSWVAWYLALIVEALNEHYNAIKKQMPLLNSIELLRELLLAAFQDVDSLPTKERAFCGKVVGVLGDPRHGVGLDINGVPEFLWCKIDGGTYKIGTDESIEQVVNRQVFENNRWGENVGFSRERPQIEIKLQPYYIAKYPVTVAQYTAFMNAADGYFCHDSWTWSPVAAEWYESNVEGRFEQIRSEKGKCNYPNFPVTDVSWIEAVSFCQWLNRKTRETYRLPTEGEWEAATRKTSAVFAWGENFDKDKTNSSFSGIGDIVPVGTYESFIDSNTPAEMNGNVWEWCYSVYPAWDSKDENLSVYSENKNYVSINNLERLTVDTMCAVRGGSFINTPMFLMNSFRGRDKISLSFYRQGFRLVKEITSHCAEPFEMIEESEVIGHRISDKYFKVGSGALVKEGDKVRLSYSVKKDGCVIENMTDSIDNLEVVLGRGQLQPEIDAFILANEPRISTSFEKTFSVCTKEATKTPEEYAFYVQIMDRL